MGNVLRLFSDSHLLHAEDSALIWEFDITLIIALLKRDTEVILSSQCAFQTLIHL